MLLVCASSQVAMRAVFKPHGTSEALDLIGNYSSGLMSRAKFSPNFPVWRTSMPGRGIEHF